MVWQPLRVTISLLCIDYLLQLSTVSIFLCAPQELEREQGDPKWLDIIEKDLHRQFPFHEMFAARGGHG